VTTDREPISPARARRPPWTRSLILILGAAVGIAALWFVLERVLGNSRGLDLSDEGLYLLAADPPSLQAAWGFPFGWHTRPLFWLVGHDISAFRTLGAVILVICSAWLGWAAARVMTRQAPQNWRTPARWFIFISAAVSAIGSLLYYSSMLRTPSYNWLNIAGILISSATALVLLNRERGPQRSKLTPALLAACSSAALFVTFPAKPTTLPLMLVLTSLLLLIASSWRVAARWAIWNVVLMPVWLLLALVTHLWPTDFTRIFKLALQMPAPDPLQTSSSAVQASLLLPRDIAAGFADIADRPALMLMVGVVLLAIPVIARRTWLLVRLSGFGISALAALAVSGVPIPVLNPTGQALGLAHAPLTTASIIVFVSALLLGSRLESRSSAAEGETSHDQRIRWVIVGFIALLPFIFSFGSGNGIYPQAAVASGLTFLAAVLCIARPRISRQHVLLAFAVLAATAVFASAAIASGWRYPYRAAPLADQQIATAVGSHGAQLLLDPALASTIAGLREQGDAAGWQPGTPLVDVSYTWNPALAYALSAKVPDFLQLTIFGYSAAHDITAFHLTQPYRDFPFSDSWILTTRNSVLDAGAQSAVAFTMERLSAVTQRPFPASYSCLAAGNFVLWRPVANPDQARQDCNG